MNANVIIELSVRDPDRGLKLSRNISHGEIFSHDCCLGWPKDIWWNVLERLSMDLDLAIYHYDFNQAGKQTPSS